MTADRAAAIERIRHALEGLGLDWSEREPGVFGVSLPGTRKLRTECALEVGRYLVGLRTFVARNPDQDHEAVYRRLLERNLKLSGVAFSVDADGDIYLTGRIPLASVDEAEIDRVLGIVADSADTMFNIILETGFADSIRREWAWRRSRGESTANLAAFSHLDPGPGDGPRPVGEILGRGRQPASTKTEDDPVTTPEISVQLYSIHPELAADLDGSLGRIADIGLRTVEAFDFVRQVDELKAAFDKYGLKAPTAHAIMIEDAGVKTPDGLLSVPPPEETFAAANALGVQVVIDPFVAPDRWATLDDVKRNADKLNERAAQAKEYGLKVGYHNHDHELTTKIDGRSALEVFAGLLDPAVLLEVDLYWAAAGGADLIPLLQGFGDRVIAVHVKDGPLRPGISARELPSDQCPAGQGDVPLADVLGAGLTLPYAVIEYDHYEGDTFDGIAQSFAFLKNTLA